MISTTAHRGFLSQNIIDFYIKACRSADNPFHATANSTSSYAFFNMPTIAEQTINNARNVIAQLSNVQPIDIVLLVGIGGSSLGVQAIYATLRHHLPDNAPKLWCADTVDPITTHTLLKDVYGALKDKKNIVLVIVSKSGTTLETCANAALYIDVLQSQGVDLARHVIIITDQQSPLEKYAQQKHIPYAHIPTALGGRFSVLSTVGIIPLMLLGIDVAELLRGARAANDALEHKENDIYLQTAMLATAYDTGLVIHDIFVSAPHLLAYGAWYRQLLAESLGKCDTINGSPRRTGITPTVSCIANDLHSMVQLYLAGPRRTITTFVDIPCTAIPDVIISNMENPLPAFASSSGGQAPREDRCIETVSFANHGCGLKQSVHHVHEALCTGVQTAYREAQLPYLHSRGAACSATTLGCLMQQQMLIITLLGHLWRINPFDQPQVEDYKKWTRQKLNANLT